MSTSLHQIKAKSRGKGTGSKRKINRVPAPKAAVRSREKLARFILLVFGISLISASFVLQLPHSPPMAKQSTTESQTASSSASFADEPVTIDKSLLQSNAKKTNRLVPPNRVLLPSLGIDLPVKEAKVINGYWQVFPDSAGFGLGSAYPGDQGNQVIFAHARQGLFADLPKLNLNDRIYVLTGSEWYQYNVVAKKEVYPNQVEVIKPTSDETLTLYTCSGFADKKRLIVVAKRTP